MSHAETHFTASQIVRDAVIGAADGLTVPFALAAGLSAAVDSTRLIVTAGLAEIAAGAIAMGLGGYLATRSDADHYDAEWSRERREIEEKPGAERAEVRDILGAYGMTGHALDAAVVAITANRERWIDWMMRFELGLERPDRAQARISALTIALAYVVGGLIPLLPYVLLSSVTTALTVSAAATAFALLLFGAGKARFTGLPVVRSALQTVVIGGLAAGAAFLLARLLGG